MADRSYTYRYDHLNQLTAVYDATDTTRKAAFTYDALGRRIEHVNDRTSTTTRYYYDGDNEVVEYNQSDARQRWYVHGVAYIDERLMLASTSHARRFFYIQDRLYNVWAMIDRAGAIVEGWCGHPARGRSDATCDAGILPAGGLPLIRESAGRGDMNNDTLIDADPDTDKTRMLDARDGVIWDPRADMDDDGDVDDDDVLLWSDADNVWPESAPTVAQAFSDVGNPFMFQGVPHFALDTADDAETATLPLNHHRARFADPVTGRWGARDPLGYVDAPNLYQLLRSNPSGYSDPQGETPAVIAIPIVGGISIAEAVAATFGLSLLACMATPECREAVEQALQDAARRGLNDARDLVNRVGRTQTFREIQDWALRNFRQTGRCTPQQHASLYAAQKAACSKSFSCDGITDCAQLGANMQAAGACQGARNRINSTCFGGGDTGHQTAAANAAAAAAKCISIMRLLDCWGQLRKYRNLPSGSPDQGGCR